jgi:hypothetical protein
MFVGMMFWGLFPSGTPYLIFGFVTSQGKVIVIRGEGPKGGPGMPEMLTPTSAIMGAGLGKVQLYELSFLCSCWSSVARIDLNHRIS